jgi:hypothetical protein
MKSLAIVVLILGVVGVAIGGAFMGLGISRYYEVKNALVVEKVDMGTADSALKGQYVDSMSSAMKMADTIRGHRHKIAPTYSDLLNGGKFDPTNPQHLTYSQGMNLENYLYLAVAVFGLTQAVMGTGAFMIIIGLAVAATGLILLRIQKAKT